MLNVGNELDRLGHLDSAAIDKKIPGTFVPGIMVSFRRREFGHTERQNLLLRRSLLLGGFYRMRQPALGSAGGILVDDPLRGSLI